MPTATSTYNDNHTVVLNLEISSAEYMLSVEKKLKDYRKTGQFKGFRQGQVPMSFLRARFGNAILFDEVSTLIDSEVNKFIQDNELYTVGRPIMSTIPPFNIQKPLDFTITVEIGHVPKFEVKGISPEVTIPFYEVEIPAAEIDTEIERIRKSTSRDFQEGVTDVQEEDVLAVALRELENGELKADGLVNETTYITVKSTSEALHTKLLASTIGDKHITTLQDLDTNLAEERMPKLYYQIEEEGTICSYEVEMEILEVRRIATRELDQEFFKEITGDDSIETLEQFRDVVTKALKEDQELPARRLFFQAMYDHLMDANKDLPMPTQFLKKWLDGESKSELSWEEFEANLDDFRWVLIKEQLARQHGISVDKEDVERAIRSEIASYYNYQISAYHPFFDKQVESMLESSETFERYARRILENKILSAISEDFSRDIKIVSKEELTLLYEETFNKEPEVNEENVVEEEVQEENAAE